MWQANTCKCTYRKSHKKGLKKILKGGDSWFFDELANLKANHYLTTNYEFQLNNKFKITRRKEFELNDDREDLLFGHEIGERDGKEVTFGIFMVPLEIQNQFFWVCMNIANMW